MASLHRVVAAQFCESGLGCKTLAFNALLKLLSYIDEHAEVVSNELVLDFKKVSYLL